MILLARAPKKMIFWNRFTKSNVEKVALLHGSEALGPLRELPEFELQA